MKKLLLAIVLTLSLHAGANAGTNLLSIQEIEKEWAGLKDYQKQNLIRIFERASQDNLGWTAVGVSWQEGKFGRFQMGQPNKSSFDCGVFHNNTKSVLDRKGLANSLYNRVGICTNLIVNPEESYLEFVKEIRYWERVKGKGMWRQIWRGYNAGYNDAGKDYAKMIGRRIAVIKKHMPTLLNTNEYYSGTLVISKDPKSI